MQPTETAVVVEEMSCQSLKIWSASAGKRRPDHNRARHCQHAHRRSTPSSVNALSCIALGDGGDESVHHDLYTPCINSTGSHVSQVMTSPAWHSCMALWRRMSLFASMFRISSLRTVSFLIGPTQAREPGRLHTRLTRPLVGAFQGSLGQGFCASASEENGPRARGEAGER